MFPSLTTISLSITITLTIILSIVYQLYMTTNQTQHMSTTNAAKQTMAKILSHAKIVPHPSSSRGHANHGWLNSYHTFSFAGYYDPRYEKFGSLRVLNEDRVAPKTGFPTHPHRDAEIFSYILNGELTHRDSMMKSKKAGEEVTSSDFYRMHRGDVQFTTGGKGIAHSEENEHDKDTVHFLQIWVLPWSRGLPPTYHVANFTEEAKRQAFVKIISPLKAGKGATAAEEKAAVPAIEGTIPIHSDFVMGAGIIPAGSTFDWTVGANGVKELKDRHTYVHVPMTTSGKAKVRLAGRDDVVLSEGDGAFISSVNAGDVLSFESIGSGEAEVVILDSA
jgi:quercetin 2,3-dioxygenase